MESPLVEELRKVVNSHNVENASNTPDFILAEFLAGCLELWAKATKARDVWYKGVIQVPGVSRAEALDAFSKVLSTGDSLAIPIITNRTMESVPGSLEVTDLELSVAATKAQGRQGD